MDETIDVIKFEDINENILNFLNEVIGIGDDFEKNIDNYIDENEISEEEL